MSDSVFGLYPLGLVPLGGLLAADRFANTNPHAALLPAPVDDSIWLFEIDRVANEDGS